MEKGKGIRITSRDRVLRAWENSTEMVRDFQAYAKEEQNDATLSGLFSDYAEEEAFHASRLLEILHEYE